MLSALFGVVCSPGRQGQCVKRAIIKHCFRWFNGVEIGRNPAQIQANLRRSDRRRLKRNRTRIYSPTHRPPFHRPVCIAPRRGPRCGSSRLAPCDARCCCIIFFGLCYWVAPAKGSKGAFAGFAGCCASPFLAHGEVVIDSSFYTLRINHHLPSACKSLFWSVLDSLDGISAPRTLAYVAQRTSAYVVQRMLAYVKLRFFNESHAFRRFTLLYAATVVVQRCTTCTVLYYVVLTYLQHRTA